MKTIDLTKKQYKKLKPLLIDEDINASEASFFKVPHNPNKIYKMYQTKRTDILEHKEEAIMDIISSKKQIDIPELILPEELVYVEDSFKGISLDYVKGCNISLFLKPNVLPLKSQIEILKELGTILQKIKNAPKNLNLAFGDVHAFQ